MIVMTDANFVTARARRSASLLSGVDRTSRILEIGPSFAPVAPKGEGWNSFSLDHLDRDGLVEKYADNSSVDPASIEAVDFVWTGGTLSDAVPQSQHGSFRVFLASHVIEHTPDLVSFLRSAETLLEAEGQVVLAVPDKRFCFDFFQTVTTTGEVLEAHRTRRTRHFRARAFDHYAYALSDGGVEAWGQRASQGMQLLHSLDKASENARILDESEDYHDLHAWRFTPASFELLILELAWLGHTDWRLERIETPSGWEFFAWLKRGARDSVRAMDQSDLQTMRLDLLKRSLLETQAQIDWLLGGTGLGMSATHLVAAMEASLSWRVTGPLRRMSARLKRGTA